jgi:hypothetical protein
MPHSQDDYHFFREIDFREWWQKPAWRGKSFPEIIEFVAILDKQTEWLFTKLPDWTVPGAAKANRDRGHPHFHTRFL